jgi:hypothetical protein
MRKINKVHSIVIYVTIVVKMMTISAEPCV